MSTIKHLKDTFEKYEASTASTIESLQARLDAIENSDHERNDTATILKKIEDTGNSITEANAIAIDRLKDDILEVRNVIIKRLAEENRNLRGRVSLLEEKILEDERRTNLMDQHSRKVNLEIDGIPESVQHEGLKK